MWNWAEIASFTWKASTLNIKLPGVTLSRLTHSPVMKVGLQTSQNWPTNQEIIPLLSRLLVKLIPRDR